MPKTTDGYGYAYITQAYSTPTTFWFTEQNFVSSIPLCNTNTKSKCGQASSTANMTCQYEININMLLKQQKRRRGLNFVQNNIGKCCFVPLGFVSLPQFFSKSGKILLKNPTSFFKTWETVVQLWSKSSQTLNCLTLSKD